MPIHYTVYLNLSKPIEGNIADLLNPLSSINPQYSINGGVVAKITGEGSIYFARDHVAFISAEPIGAPQSVRFALLTAKYLQGELSGIGLEFDPNSIYLEIGNYANVKKLKPICSIIQKRLYGGGNFAIVTGLVEYTIVLGTEEKIVQASGRKEIVETEGTAKQRSLDELLDKLNNAKSQ